MQQSTTTVLDGVNWRSLAVQSLKVSYYILLLYCTYLMFLITAQYLPLNLEAAFLRVKQEALAYAYYAPAFFSHVFTSIVVLVVGLPQFSSYVRTRWPSGHRRLGYAYIVLILGVASPTGLVMALHANGGWTAQLSFVLQAILWWSWTYKALATARQQDWEQHQHYMARSYALTLSAITLRLWKWGIVALWAPPPMDTYRVVAWLGWLGNLALVELYFFTKRKRLYKS